jgi:spore maturation protein CgeB
VAKRFPQLRVWTQDIDAIPRDSALRACYAGVAWGREMYRILAGSRIALNHHGPGAPHASNCRLYEATGMGALLLTDWQEDLGMLFEVGREIAAYRDTEECLALIAQYLEDEPARARIAAAGAARTLRDHTYRQRAQELLALL